MDRAIAAAVSQATKPAPARAAASTTTDEGFRVGYTDVGPVLGLGGLAGAGAGFGGRFETAFKDLPNLGNGVLGIGVGVDYFHWSNDLLGTGYSFSYIPISVTANYHFQLKNKKIDPFLGLGLGDLIVHTSCDFAGCGGAASGIYFVGHAGIRYFWRPTTALYVDAGAGAGSLHVGLMFKMKGKK